MTDSFDPFDFADNTLPPPLSPEEYDEIVEDILKKYPHYINPIQDVDLDNWEDKETND